jgi:hypothetical protein
MQNGPQFFFRFKDVNNKGITTLDPTFGKFYINMEQTFQDANGDYRRIVDKLESTFWDENELLGENGEVLMESGVTFCFLNKSETIYGADVSLIRKKLIANLAIWNKVSDSNCQSASSIDEFFENADLRAFVINKYYDFNDIDNPIKEYLEDYRHERIVFDQTKITQLHVRENRVIEYDSIFPWGATKERKFYSISGHYSTIRQRNTGEQLIRYEFILDSQIDIYERFAYTIIDMASDIGGTFELLAVVAVIINSIFARKLYLIGLLNNIKGGRKVETLNKIYVNQSQHMRRSYNQVSQAPLQRNSLSNSIQNIDEDHWSPFGIQNYTLKDLMLQFFPWKYKIKNNDTRQIYRRINEFQKEKKMLLDELDWVRILNTIWDLKLSVAQLKRQNVYQRNIEIEGNLNWDPPSPKSKDPSLKSMFFEKKKFLV